MIRIALWRIALAATALVCAAEGNTAPSSAEHLIAQAIQFEYAEGVPRNPAMAADLYCAAAHLGSPDAAYRLGWMYANARGIDRDDGYAVALFRHAAAQGHEYARRTLQLIHSEAVRLPPCMTAPAEQSAQAQGAAPDTTDAQLAKAEPAGNARSERVADERSGAPARAQPALVAADEHRDVLDALTNWADAWSRRDVEAYLAAYVQGFAASIGQSQRQWEQQRRARIAGKSWIAVGIDALSIDIEGDVARARFRQNYRSDRLHASSGKILTLVKVDRRWLIRQERIDD